MRVPTPNTKRRRRTTSRATAASGGPVAPEASYVGRRDRRVRAGARTRGHVFPRRRSSVPARRGALAVLLVACLALITVSYRGGAVLHGTQLAVLDAVAPIERGLSRAWDPIAGAWDWTGRLFSATSENPKLKRENAELRAKLRAADVNSADVARLQADLNLDQTFLYPAGYDRVWASVTTRQPGTVESSFVIDRGSKDGIRKDDPVMAVPGLIGHVTNVMDDYAVVSLIVDDTQRVSASVVDSDAWGVLRTVSTEGVPTMQLKFVKQSAKVEEGDQVITSGFASKNGELRSIYPKGLPIGYVSSVGNDPADLHKTVQVTPLVDFDRIDEVMVLVRRNPVEVGTG
ncbi:MAG: rod shape-determining protein MreC [Thermoleophilia bacterium]|nr:rod shape-determining protein MreC [Thermoleophilia bacterium]